MKLSSCACAAVVSAVPLMDRIAVDPIGTPSFFRPGTIVLFTWLASCEPPSTATFLPLSILSFFNSWNRTATVRSAVAPG